MVGNNLKIVAQCVATFLPVKDFLKCRLVCSTWQKLIDKCSFSDKLWHERCYKDFPDISISAFIKSRLCWCRLYKSLKLWNKLPYTRDNVVDFAPVTNHIVKVLGIQVLRDGVIGVHSIDKIIYYDLYTLQLSYRRPFIGCYYKYKENDYIISCLNYRKQLTVAFKPTSDFIQEDMVMVDIVENVDLYLILERNVYCLAEDNNVYVFELVDGEFVCTDSHYVPNGVMSLGHINGDFYILTNCCKVLKLENDELMNVELKKSEALLMELNKYNFFEELDPKMYYCWISFIKNRTHLISRLTEVVTLRIYRHFMFLGYDYGELHVHNLLYYKYFQKVNHIHPIKVFKLMNPQTTICPIICIDIIEDIDSHKIIVAMPQKIVVINLAHDI